MNYFLALVLLIFSSVTTPLWAGKGKYKLDTLNEIRILSSLNIHPSFAKDPKYIRMKNNIDTYKATYFVKTLKQGNIFMPNLHELLGESDIPDTFLYMAMVESKFLADVKSHKNAAGLWQLIPSTAEQFKLKMNASIDERLDPIKSTRAAIKYLRYLHERFGKWYLAAIAYNCGESRLASAIEEAKTDSLSVLIDPSNDYLPKETQDYIRRILVAALLAYDDEIVTKNNANHLFGSCTNSKLVEVFFDGGTSLSTIALEVGVPVEKIKTCNPHLLTSNLPIDQKTCRVYLPQELIGDLKKSDASVAVGRFSYTIQEGDTLFLLSKRFNIKLETVKMLNPALKKRLKIGQKITLIGDDKNLPAKSSKSKTVVAQSIAPTPVKTPESNNTVKTVQTALSQEANNTAIPFPKLEENATKTSQMPSDLNITKVVESNSTKLTDLKAKKPLKNTPQPSKKSSSKEETFQYVVQKSDSAHSISLKFNNRIETLQKLNPGFPKNLKAGIKLTIKR